MDPNTNDAAVASLRAELAEARRGATPEAIVEARAAWKLVGDQPNESDAKFACAKLLALTTSRRDSAEGVAVLYELLRQGYKASECQFLICVGHLHRGEYSECRTNVVELVRCEPANERSAALLEILRSRVAEEGRWSWMVMGAIGAAVVITGLALWMYSARPRTAPPRFDGGGQQQQGRLRGGGGASNNNSGAGSSSSWRSRYGDSAATAAGGGGRGAADAATDYSSRRR